MMLAAFQNHLNVPEVSKLLATMLSTLRLTSVSLFASFLMIGKSTLVAITAVSPGFQAFISRFFPADGDWIEGQSIHHHKRTV